MAISSKVVDNQFLPIGTELTKEPVRSLDIAGLESLVRQAVEGCGASFSQLADRFRPRMCILLDRYLADFQTGLDAEDVVQESLVKAYQNLRRYDSKYRFSTWLYTIAFRTAQDHIRRNRRWTRMFRLGTDDVLTSPAQFEKIQESKDHAENIWAVAKSILKTEQYSALWLRYGEDLEMHEIAQILGRTQGAVRVLLHRSRMAILEHTQSLERIDHARRFETKAGGIK